MINTNNNSVYKKLQSVRYKLTNADIKKTGKLYNGQPFFQLEDFLPYLVKFSQEEGIAEKIDILKEEGIAVLTIFDVENENSFTTFTIPLEFAVIQKAQLIQALGGTITYYRRYLYMLAFCISESDMVDDPSNFNDNSGKVNSNKSSKAQMKTTAEASKDKDLKSELIKNINKSIDPKSIAQWLQMNQYNTLSDVPEEVLASLWKSYTERLQQKPSN